MVDVVRRQWADLLADVDRLRAHITRRVAAVEADAVDLARVDRSEGAEAVCTNTISERIRELIAAQADLAKKTAQFRDLTIGMDVARRAFSGTDDS
jgi:hypothetical protein